MSFTQREIIDEILKWQKQKGDEVRELKRMKNRFSQNERTQKAIEVAFGERLTDLRSQFSQFFSRQPQDG